MSSGVESPSQRARPLGPEQRRPQILDAALRLSVERGPSGVSMDAIAELVGVTKPVVYDCFASKTELVRALLAREEERLTSHVTRALPADPDFGDFEGMLRSIFTAFLSAVAAEPDSWRVVYHWEHGADPAIRRRMRRGRELQTENIRRLVERAMRARGASDAERVAEPLAHVIAGAAEGVVALMIERPGEWSADELGALLAGLLARGEAGVGQQR